MDSASDTLRAAAVVLALLASPVVATGGDPDGPGCRELRYAGRAVDLDSGELVYVEDHRQTLCAGRPTESFVVYRDARGDTLITKRVDFSRFPTMPDMRFDDHRTGYAEATAVEGDSLVLLRRADGEAAFERKALHLDGPAVVDAGFDPAVRQSWDRLAAGEAVTVDFAVPNKLRKVRFHIRRLEAGSTEGWLRLRIEPASFWLRLIAPHIEVTYDTRYRRLHAYEGITNVPSSSGRRYRARIEFAYPEPPASVGSSRSNAIL